MRIAFVHDDLTQWGGAERLLLGMLEVFPGAPIYTTVVDFSKLPSVFSTLDIRPSFMQKVLGVKRFPRAFAPLYPFAVESFDLTSYDIIVSSSTRFAHGIIPGPRSIHLCFMNTPAKMWWDSNRYFGTTPLWLEPALAAFRAWDQIAALRVDQFLANSQNVRRRIEKYYRRESIVLHPFVDLARFAYLSRKGKFFLIVSRLLKYKHIDLAVQACSRLHLPLVVIGSGPDEKRLCALAGPTVRFAGQLTDDAVVAYYRDCLALIIPGEEDFGMTALEAFASGKPVIAFVGGGALETVVDGKTGMFFREPTIDSLISVLKRFEKTAFSGLILKAHARTWSKQNFQRKFRRLVEKAGGRALG
ncbi:MAG: glycosyltransferase [bacterium]|nr:glycosyltransferase [bacterium]